MVADPARGLRPAAVSRTTGSTRSKRLADSLPGGVVDCSIGTPCDPGARGRARAAAADALADVEGLSRVGRQRRAARRRGRVDRRAASASRSTPRTSARASAPRSSSRRCRTSCGCATRSATPCCIPRSRTRPTRWARCSPAAARCPCRSTRDWHLDLDAIAAADAERALVLWVNEPGNPTSSVADADALRARRGVGARARHRRRERRVLRRVRARAGDDPARPGSTACSRCTACRSARTSPGMRVGFYAGDPDLVDVPRRDPQARGPHGADAGAGRGGGRARRRRARRRAARPLRRAARARARRARAARPRARRRAVPLLPLAARATTAPTTAGRSRRGSRTRPACSSSPGDLYGAAGADHVRLALVQPRERLELAFDRLAHAAS